MSSRIRLMALLLIVSSGACIPVFGQLQHKHFSEDSKVQVSFSLHSGNMGLDPRFYLDKEEIAQLNRLLDNSSGHRVRPPEAEPRVDKYGKEKRDPNYDIVLPTDADYRGILIAELDGDGQFISGLEVYGKKLFQMLNKEYKAIRSDAPDHSIEKFLLDCALERQLVGTDEYEQYLRYFDKVKD